MRFFIEDLEVFFPYDFVYREQYTYMLELKRALDAKGDGILEMPTGTGKTVSILSLITSYQYAHPECGKLIYCTRTVPEMIKCIEELKRVIAYRTKCLGAGGDILAVCLSSRRNMCIHPDLVEESDRDKVDSGCRSMTASWVRAKAQAGDPSVKTCDFFEGYESSATDAEVTGIFNLDDIKALGHKKGWCPYFLARHVISYAGVVVYNYQYMLDPKIAQLVSKELEDKSIVVFDEAHNIDNVCIEALSVTLDRKAIDTAARNLLTLDTEVKRLKQADARKLQEEYARLLGGLSAGIGGASGGAAGGAAAGGGSASSGPPRGGDELPGAPVLPDDLLQEAVPGNIRNAELFVRFMKHIVRYLKEKVRVAAVQSIAPSKFLLDMATELSIDVKPLKFAYSRLNSLMKTLQVTTTEDFTPITLVADFVTLLATYPVGFMVILEPYNAKTPHIPDPIMQLACLDASLAIKPVLQKYQSVILTSGTLSPLDMYPKMLNFNPVVRVSLEMSIVRPCICPMIVSRAGDQSPMTTKFEVRDDETVLRNYGNLLIQLCSTVPDGIVAFFPSYSYMEMIISAWHRMDMLRRMERHKLLFIETKDIVETTLSLNNYKRACDVGRGAVFFSIARGKVAEGIDFDRHYGRAVVLFGIPFQYTLSHVLRARLVYLRETYNIREQDFLTFDAIRQSSQCIGRIIRSKRDYGIIVFADKRYASSDKRNKLPQWVLQFLPEAHINLSTDMAVHISRKFLKEMAQPVAEEKDRSKTLLTAEDLERMAAASGYGRAAAARAGAAAGGSSDLGGGGVLAMGGYRSVAGAGGTVLRYATLPVEEGGGAATAGGAAAAAAGDARLAVEMGELQQYPTRPSSSSSSAAGAATVAAGGRAAAGGAGGRSVSAAPGSMGGIVVEGSVVAAAGAGRRGSGAAGGGTGAAGTAEAMYASLRTSGSDGSADGGDLSSELTQVDVLMLRGAARGSASGAAGDSAAAALLAAMESSSSLAVLDTEGAASSSSAAAASGGSGSSTGSAASLSGQKRSFQQAETE